jgi:NADPH:quinone reductase-like Zn-dependent oxidoreductase
MKCVVYRGTGGPEIIAIEERPDPAPGKFEVLIAPTYSGMNPADVLQRQGKHPVPAGSPKDVPGLEVAGTIVAVGDGVSSFEVGDRAMGLVGGGGHASMVVAHERDLARVPDVLDDLHAAAVPEAYLTAYDAIVTQCGLAAGDVLLVNGASGGVGTAAVQMARSMNVTVVASVRSDAVRAKVEQLGVIALPPEEAFAKVRELGGADVVLELVGGINVPEDVASLALRGRVIIVGGGTGGDPVLSLRDMMSKRATVIGTGLRRRPLEQKATLMQDFNRRVVPLLASGEITPVVDRAFPIEDAVVAFAVLAEPGKFGKLLLHVA